jgi:hypothetical protein
VELTAINDNNPFGVFSTCFRPDIGSLTPYEVTLSMRLTGTECVFSQLVSISVDCPPGAPDLKDIVGSLTQSVDRSHATRVHLNASGVIHTALDTLSYNWKVLGPPPSGATFRGPTIINPQSIWASFVIPQSGVDYIVELSVTDHCRTSVKNITIKTPCSQFIPLDNKTLAAVYTGEIPVQMMSFAYDHTVAIAAYLSYPRCQSYFWELKDYSARYSDAFYASSEPEFSKTGGFAALISVVVIVAVIVPIVLWMYFTKKACFNKTDPRV